MRDNDKTNSKIGERKIMNCGEECEIVEYRKYSDITVRFIKTSELVKSEYGKFKNGTIKSHFTPSVYGAGIIGLEKIKDKYSTKLKSYRMWQGMLQRCYDKKLHEKRPTYKDCKVYDKWLYYYNFKKWFNENYYEINNEKICLDKDILIKANKIYSPETCILVPQSINSLFVKSNAIRGELPIGVRFNKRDDNYLAVCCLFNSINGESKQKYLGRFNTPEEAFYAYKKAKEENIKQVADHYKNQIPKKLYEAMYRYEVHIDD